MSNRWGEFEGEVITKWLRNPNGPDRDMMLTTDLTYIDQHGQRWEAQQGRTVNGASIPEAFWTVIGPPFVGDYRRASVVHDIGCEDQVSTSDQVHEMFYNAMRCDGVGAIKAQVMYQAVRKFGPQWGAGPAGVAAARTVTVEDASRIQVATEKAFESLGIDASNEEISKAVDNILSEMTAI